MKTSDFGARAQVDDIGKALSTSDSLNFSSLDPGTQGPPGPHYQTSIFIPTIMGKPLGTACLVSLTSRGARWSWRHSIPRYLVRLEDEHRYIDSQYPVFSTLDLLATWAAEIIFLYYQLPCRLIYDMRRRCRGRVVLCALPIQKGGCILRQLFSR